MATAKATSTIKNGHYKAKEALSEAASVASDQVTEQFESAKSAIQDHAPDLTKLADDGVEFIRRNPGTSIAVAVGAGIALGLFLNKRS